MRNVGRTFAGAVLLAAAFAGCLFPNEATRHLVVTLDTIPRLTKGDTISLSAHVMDGSVEVPNSQVQFSVTDPGVATVTPDGLLTAIDSGSTVVLATVVGIADVTPGQTTVDVHSRLEVDSITPTSVAFGDTLTIYGSGLDPASLFSVQLGGFTVPTKSFVADDPAHPDGPGRLSVWVTPPAGEQSRVQITTAQGARLIQTPVTVAQHDIYEPNNTAAVPLSLPFYNPGLALEAPPRGFAPELVDWYTFTLPSASNVSTRIHSDFASVGPAYSVVLSDSMFYDFGYYIGYNHFAVSNGYGAFCHNQWLGDPVQAAATDAVFALGNLPAGTYHLWIQYARTSALSQPYALTIDTTYRSDLPKDAFEENDYCESAASLDQALAAGGHLTIDTPFDIDWFDFSEPSGGLTVLQVTAQSDTADIDAYIYSAADTLQMYGLSGGQDEVIAANLPAGDYQLMLADYAGAPTNYTLARVRQEAEPNDQVAQADTLTLTDWRQTNLWGEITTNSDTDYVAVYAVAGKTLEFWLRASDFISPLAPKLILRDSAGTKVAQDDPGGYYADIWYDVPTTGWYRLGIVRSPGTPSGPGYFWVLQAYSYDFTLGTPSGFAALRQSGASRTSSMAAQRQARTAKLDVLRRRQQTRARMPRQFPQPQRGAGSR